MLMTVQYKVEENIGNLDISPKHRANIWNLDISPKHRENIGNFICSSYQYKVYLPTFCRFGLHGYG